MKAIKQVMKKDQEPYRVPKRVQDVIPIKCMWSDGIFLVGTRYSKTFKFTDINYMVASQEAQKKLFLAYAALINSLDCGATTKITLNNRHLNRKNFADTVLMKLKNDYLDYYRMEYNDVIMSKATGGNGIIQEKYVTVSVCKKNIEDARAYFARVGAELTARFAALGAKVTEMDATEKLRVLHDFYRNGEEVYFRFDAQDIQSYDIHDLGEELKQPGFVTITDAMINRVNYNWAHGKKTHIFVDEFHIAYENEYSGNFFTSAWRQFRKRNAAPCAITQNVEYMLDSVQASTMVSNSEFVVMLNQAESDQERLSKLLNISPEQMSYVNGSEAGCGLMRYGSALVPFVNRFPANTELYKLITTKPGEGLFAKGRVDCNA